MSNLAAREALAAYAHEAWSGWMVWVFQQSPVNADGTATIPAWAVREWQRQMHTPYQHLPARDQDQDRAEADKMLHIIAQYE